MASMRDIKRRKSSVESTQQITKAMKLVSTVKLQRAKARAEQSKYYFRAVYETVTSILAKAGEVDFKVTGREVLKPEGYCTYQLQQGSGRRIQFQRDQAHYT